MKRFWRQGDSGRVAILAALAFAAVVGGFALVQQLGVSFAETSAQDAEMVLEVKSGSVACATPAPGEVCVPLDGDFTLSVDIIDAPDAGYNLAQSWVKFGDNLIFNPGTPATEIVWANCLDAVAVRILTNPGHVGHGCLTGLLPPLPVSTYTGNYVDLSMTCSDSGSTQEIEILLVGTPPAGTSGSLFKDPGNNDVVPKPDTMTLNCGPGGALPTSTHTHTPTNTPVPPTNTPTITNTPTHTPTHTPPPGAVMSLSAEGDGIISCPGKCNAEYWPGQEKDGEFQVFVNAHEPPVGDYGGFLSEVEITGDLELTYNPRAACADEVVWPDADDGECTRVINAPPPPVSVSHESFSASAPDFPLSDHDGELVELDIHCSGADGGTLEISGDSTFYDEDGNELETNPLGTLEINCVVQPSEMSMSVHGDGIECDTADKPEKCTAPFIVGATTQPLFTVSIDANAIPDGYGGFQTDVWYTGLNYVERSCLQEIAWRPDFAPAFLCLVGIPPAEADQTNRRLEAYGDAFPPHPASDHVGTLVELQFRCPSEGQFPIWLTAWSNLSPLYQQGSAFFATNDDVTRLSWPDDLELAEIDRNGDGILQAAAPENVALKVLDLVRINCEAPPPTPTNTITPTPTVTGLASPTPTNTPCDGPCPTPTPTFTPTASNTPTNTGTPTNTNTPTNTPIPTPFDEIEDEVGPGGKVTTGTKASENDQLETSVTVPIGGVVSISETVVVQPDPPGFALFGQQSNISAPAGTVNFPVVIQFWLDTSMIEAAEAAGGGIDINAANIPVFVDGTFVPDCTGAPNTASPSPCVAKRNDLAGIQTGDIQLMILTTNNSLSTSWNFGYPSGEKPDLGDVDGNGSVDAQDALWVLFHSAGIATPPFLNVGDVSGDGNVDPLDAALILQYNAALIDEFPADAGVPSGNVRGWLSLF